MEKFWSHLPRLHKHPLFSQQSEFQQGKMRAFSQGLNRYSVEPTLRNSMEGPDKYQARVTEPATSRKRHIQDGGYYWKLVEDAGAACYSQGGLAPRSMPAMFEFTGRGSTIGNLLAHIVYD
jgi:hypothetical protein